MVITLKSIEMRHQIFHYSKKKLCEYTLLGKISFEFTNLNAVMIGHIEIKKNHSIMFTNIIALQYY